MTRVLAIAVAAALAVSATAHAGYGDGTCVDVIVDGATTPDTLCPVADPLAVRTLAAKGATVYFGVARKPVTLIFARKTVTARPGADGAYAVAVKGAPSLGAIASGGDQRDVDIFGLPLKGRATTIARLRDEHNRRVRLLAAAPHLLRGDGRRRYALCTGIQIGAFSPGRTLCETKVDAFQVRFSADCKHHRQLVYGTAPTRIAKASAVLTNGRTARVAVTRVPRSVKARGVVLHARLTGALATKVRGYDASGRLLATASLGDGCSGAKTRSKIR